MITDGALDFLSINKPLTAHYFQVSIGADPLGSFTEVSNITYEIQPYELIEGGRNFSPHLKPFQGPGKRGELSLKWGSVKRDKLQSWVESVQIGYLHRRNVLLFQALFDFSPEADTGHSYLLELYPFELEQGAEW